MVYNKTQDVFIYIRQLMIADDISIKELAQRMNKTPGATSAILRQTNVSLETLNDICVALGCKLIIDLQKIDH